MKAKTNRETATGVSRKEGSGLVPALPPTPGDIANALGDISLGDGFPPVASGILLLTFAQAFAALRYGWTWVGSDDGLDIAVQRGGVQWTRR